MLAGMRVPTYGKSFKSERFVLHLVRKQGTIFPRLKKNTANKVPFPRFELELPFLVENLFQLLNIMRTYNCYYFIFSKLP